MEKSKFYLTNNYNATKEDQKRRMLENQRESLQLYKCNEAIKAEKYTVMKKRLDSLLTAVGSLQAAV